MSPIRLFGSFVVCFVLTFSITAQQNPLTPQPVSVLGRDAQALAVLQSSLRAMGGSVPSDSVATGSIVIVAGSQTSQGTTSVLTRGTNQTAVTVQAGPADWSVLYSNGSANRSQAGTSVSLPLEAVMSSQSPYFPLPFLSGILVNPDYSIAYIGAETLNGINTAHLRLQNTFSSSSGFQSLSEFTTTDIWVDATSGLPRQISFTRRDAGGSTPKISVSVFFQNYQLVSGIQYPFTIEESINGTLWAITSIHSVVFNSGLTDANFPVTQGSN
jgi:hypothetical protein